MWTHFQAGVVEMPGTAEVLVVFAAAAVVAVVVVNDGHPVLMTVGSVAESRVVEVEVA